MTREEFEKIYLNKEVTLRTFDDDTYTGILRIAKYKKNYYTIDGHSVFRKSHIVKIKLS